MQREKDITNNEEMAEFINSQLVQDFVGKNYSYYKKKWEQIISKKFFFRMNWCALFLGPIWYAYRKMYLYLFLFVGSVVLMGALEDMISPYFAMKYFDIALFMAVGMTANDLYLWFVRRKIHKLKDKNLVNETAKKKGGVSTLAAVAVSMAYLVLFIVMVVIVNHSH